MIFIFSNYECAYCGVIFTTTTNFAIRFSQTLLYLFTKEITVPVKKCLWGEDIKFKKNWNMKNQGKNHKWLNEIEQNIFALCIISIQNLILESDVLF